MTRAATKPADDFRDGLHAFAARAYTAALRFFRARLSSSSALERRAPRLSLTARCVTRANA